MLGSERVFLDFESATCASKRHDWDAEFLLDSQNAKGDLALSSVSGQHLSHSVSARWDTTFLEAWLESAVQRALKTSCLREKYHPADIRPAERRYLAALPVIETGMRQLGKQMGDRRLTRSNAFESFFSTFIDLFERLRECLNERRLEQQSAVEKLEESLRKAREKLELDRKEQPQEMMALMSELERTYTEQMEDLEGKQATASRSLDTVRKQVRGVRSKYEIFFPNLIKLRGAQKSALMQRKRARDAAARERRKKEIASSSTRKEKIRNDLDHEVTSSRPCSRPRTGGPPKELVLRKTRASIIVVAGVGLEEGQPHDRQEVVHPHRQEKKHVDKKRRDKKKQNKYKKTSCSSRSNRDEDERLSPTSSASNGSLLSRGATESNASSSSCIDDEDDERRSKSASSSSSSEEHDCSSRNSSTESTSSAASEDAEEALVEDVAGLIQACPDRELLIRSMPEASRQLNANATRIQVLKDEIERLETLLTSCEKEMSHPRQE
ncbi:unnamed protein product [Amoebophrya sp. A25]|nr:unnamed protein product [Amoebophrya sp. A25]|eukprot:GSA25T00024973001.1